MADINPEQLKDLCSRLADVRTRMASLKATGDALAAEIRAILQGTEDVTVGSMRVTCKPSKRFSVTLAETLLSKAVLDSISETKVSDKLAKELLPPKTYEACRENHGEPRITFTAVK